MLSFFLFCGVPKESGRCGCAHRPVESSADFIANLPDKVKRLCELVTFPSQQKKLPWEYADTAELPRLPDKANAHKRSGCPLKAKPYDALPSFARYLIRMGLSGGQNPATRSVWTSHPLKWSWHLMPSPGLVSRRIAGMTGEVIGQGSMRSGAGREAEEQPYAPRISGKRRYA
jgi:hypothetical protein